MNQGYAPDGSHEEGEVDWRKWSTYEPVYLIEAAEELLEVAELRGDNTLPHPANDDRLWTARMQTAWFDLEVALHQAKDRQPTAEDDVSLGRYLAEQLAALGTIGEAEHFEHELANWIGDWRREQSDTV